MPGLQQETPPKGSGKERMSDGQASHEDVPLAVSERAGGQRSSLAFEELGGLQLASPFAHQLVLQSVVGLDFLVWRAQVRIWLLQLQLLDDWLTAAGPRVADCPADPADWTVATVVQIGCGGDEFLGRWQMPGSASLQG